LEIKYDTFGTFNLKELVWLQASVQASRCMEALYTDSGKDA